MKQINSFPFYLINEDGTEIINTITNRKIVASEQMINKVSTKYLYVTLCNEGYYWKRIADHRLVAFTFVDNPNNYNEVNHKDRNRQNNHYTNLEWVTHQYNMKHSFENGREQAKGVDSKLYGRKASKHTKQLQSVSKLGIKHPKFKGYYMVSMIVQYKRLRCHNIVTELLLGGVKLVR